MEVKTKLNEFTIRQATEADVGLAHLSSERKCGRLEWSVLNWNEPAIKFYRSIGAVPMVEWTVQRVTGEALEQLAGKFDRA